MLNVIDIQAANYSFQSFYEEFAKLPAHTEKELSNLLGTDMVYSYIPYTSFDNDWIGYFILLIKDRNTPHSKMQYVFLPVKGFELESGYEQIDAPHIRLIDLNSEDDFFMLNESLLRISQTKHTIEQILGLKSE